MNKVKDFFLIFILLGCFKHYGQVEVIEMDTLTMSATKIMPYNRPFTIKVLINATEIQQVDVIRQYKYHDLSGSISYYVNKKGTFSPITIPSHYYEVKKSGDKYYLFLTFANEYMLEPSESYFIIISQKKLDVSVVNFFDNYYVGIYGLEGERQVALEKAKEALTEFTTNMKKNFVDVKYGYFDIDDFNNSTNNKSFADTFNLYLKNDYNNYKVLKDDYVSFLSTKTPLMMTRMPDLSCLTNKQLVLDTLINKEALNYLMGTGLVLNDQISDIQTIKAYSKFENIISGVTSLNCIFCNSINSNSALLTDLNKRITILDENILILNRIKRALILLKAYEPTLYCTNSSIDNLLTWIQWLEESKSKLKNIIKVRKSIEDKILNKMKVYGLGFLYSSLISGNSYLNFETRNKVLLTPDFGLVTSSFTNGGKSLEYGIIPYLGFHINFKAVDKDIEFKSYKKDWRQYCSFMVGWSLVNMQQDSTYSNFFEKSSLLTGFGFRLSNAIRLSVGTQWLFKSVNESNPKRNLVYYPFIGLSFDLNVKQYLNGFVDLLSGIGKTKSSKTEIKLEEK